MEQKKQTATLLVDGEVLKQHVLKFGGIYTPQLVLQYLHHMVSQIQSQFPETKVRVHYYGVQPIEDVMLPISQKKYQDADIRETLNLATLPNAELKTFWGRMYYPYEQPWVLKPESYNKTKLEDDDFLLNEQPKGLLTKLVDAMAEKAVCHRDNRLFVYGDADDMAYALSTTNGLGLAVSQILLDGNRPYISEYIQENDPVVCPKNILEEVGESLRQPWTRGETLSGCLGLLRGAMEVDGPEILLMLDVGSIRQYIYRQGLRMSVQNMEKLIHQIQESLPEKATKTIFYHATTSSVENFHIGSWLADESSIEIELQKKNLSIPGVHLSLGKIQLDKNFPTILKKEKWHVHPTSRLKEDFVKNIRQYDVDDRIAYDMALARLNPMVKRVYLLSTDGDFAYSLEQAGRAGLSVSLVRLEETTKGVSARLEHRAEDVVQVPVDLTQLISRREEQAAVRERNDKEKHERLRQIQQQKKISARLEAEDEDDEYGGYRSAGPSKEERWGKVRVSHKKTAFKIIAKTRRKFQK